MYLFVYLIHIHVSYMMVYTYPNRICIGASLPPFTLTYFDIFTAYYVVFKSGVFFVKLESTVLRTVIQEGGGVVDV
jgi:hypothetical protein